MARFSNCVYAEYFAEYSMRLCKHPKNKGCVEAPCKGCTLHESRHNRLEKCPFCKSSNVTLIDGYRDWYVQCCKCGARGPVKKDAREAKEAWSKRT